MNENHLNSRSYSEEKKTSAHIKHGENDAFEKGARFVQRPLQALIILGVKLFVRLNIFPNGIEKYNAQEELSLWRLHAGYENPRGSAT